MERQVERSGAAEERIGGEVSVRPLLRRDHADPVPARVPVQVAAGQGGRPARRARHRLALGTEGDDRVLELGHGRGPAVDPASARRSVAVECAFDEPRR